ncbi:MAG: bifunctional phosphopantothenoylcysteine decarboxylase/phosphopantothenate--cysteine ligase CoaBC [candidate division Zixibacteria bacterium]|nr:bifunctional phosphopantothenoylcysteine decarboxylase/phosphopantothenate--cysteine ligase CoaBC [candidate division Zixibacteria bacterium]
MSLKNKKIIVGLTGGIAAYKTPVLIRLLKQAGAEVRTIMTLSATKFITPLTIETVSQNPVACEMFPDRYASTHHIDLAEWADLFVVAPATANCIGKIASGICDDLLSTVICATKAPIMFAPAMNNQMYVNAITQNNIEYLKSLDYLFVGPGIGELACETTGVGRMLEPNEIFAEIDNYFRKKKVKKRTK